MYIIQKLLDMCRIRDYDNETASSKNSDIIISIERHQHKSHSSTFTHDDYVRIRRYWKCIPPQFCTRNYIDATPEEYLLYGKTLLLNAYQRCAPIPNGYCCYFYEECKLSNPAGIHKDLIKQGYFTNPSVSELLWSYTVKELKPIAKSLGCKCSGLKKDIINNIIANMPLEQQQLLINNSDCYIISDKGRRFLEYNSDYVELHRNFKLMISLSELNRVRIKNGTRQPFTDSALEIISSHIEEDCIIHNFTNMIFDTSALYNILLKQSDYNRAAIAYLKFLYLKSCCSFSIDLFNNDLPIYPVDTAPIFSSYCAVEIVRLSHFINDRLIIETYNTDSLPPSLLTLQEFTNMIHDMLEQPVFDYDVYNNIIYQRLKYLAVIDYNSV